MGMLDWLQGLHHISQFWNGSSERGVDINHLPVGTPIYAIVPMNNVKTGYYGGGGVVSGDTIINGKKERIYYQHFDLIDSNIRNGSTIQAGTYLGGSGGQLSGGHHPASPQFSTGPHMEIGINPHFGGIWGTDLGPNVNPLPWLTSIINGTSHENYGPVGGVPVIGSGIVGQLPPGSTFQEACTPPNGVLDVGGSISYAMCQAKSTFVSFGEHIAVFIIALLLIGGGVYLLAHKQINAAVGNAVEGIKEATKESAQTSAEVAAV